MDILNIIGVIATVAAAFVTFYATYISIKLSKEKKDRDPTYLFTDHSRYTHHDNSVSLKVDNKTVNNYDYVPGQEKGKKPNTKKSRIQSGFLEFVIETSKLIKQLKLIAFIVSLAFTAIYLFLIVMDVHFFGTSHIYAILNIESNKIIYTYIFLSLFLLIYSFILLTITAWYSKELSYQAKIRDLVKINDLSLFKQKLLRGYNFSKFDEFPIRAITRIIDNIRIEDKNEKSYRYNNRVIHKPKKEIISTRSNIFHNTYFQIIFLIIIINIAYMLFYPSFNQNLSHSQVQRFISNSTMHNKYSETYVLNTTKANFRSSGAKRDNNIIRTIRRKEAFYSYKQSGRRWWKVKTQDGQEGYLHHSVIKRY